MSSDEIAVSVRNLTKTYRIFGHAGDRVKEAITFGLKPYHKTFTALSGVSLEIRKGETVGIIGRNGSGKSTLLQLICGILKPTAGSVEVNGRVSALLELGAGFNPEFTGRENIYFQGALAGFRKPEIEERFDEIVAFADIGEFIDQPVRTYSSGMFVRLAAAVAIHVDPEILIVDEALAVGDIGYQTKCLDRMQSMRQSGTTIVIVSHDIMLMRAVGDRLFYLEKGRLRSAGDPEAVGEAYIRDVGQVAAGGAHPSHSRASTPSHLVSVHPDCTGDVVRVAVKATLQPAIASPELVIQFRDPRGYIIYGAHARGTDVERSSSGLQDEVTATLEVEASRLVGEYSLSASLNSLDAGGHPTVLDKWVGAAILRAPSADRSRFHGIVNFNGRWLRNGQCSSKP